MRVIDAIQLDDIGIRLAGGITTANIMPNSGNVINCKTVYGKLCAEMADANAERDHQGQFEVRDQVPGGPLLRGMAAEIDDEDRPPNLSELTRGKIAVVHVARQGAYCYNAWTQVSRR